MSVAMETDDLDYLLPTNGPNPYFDTWDRHNSIAFSTATKGLRNAPGENNCFVNSAVQVFWHLDVFRRSYRRLSGHTCMGNSCIFCALKVIFTQFQFSDQTSLHPDALRKALAETFANQQRFQLRHMDDAAECFENILRRIHFHIANNCNEDHCTAPHCLPHQKFSLNIVEKVMCPCGASSDPLTFNEMVHYISAKALVSQARLMQETGDVLHPDRFGLLLRNANAMGDIRDCPGACGKKVQIRRTLLNSPDVVSIGLVWDSDHPTVEMTTEVARNIGTTILMQDVFHSVMQDLSYLPKLQLVGLVCYYGKHYSTFVFHSKLQVWIYFDDATVREIGPRWDQVVDKCSKGRYQPLLLLYANPNASPVSVETAPKKRTMAPGYGIPGGPEEESALDRTHESISSQHSSQRSRTPNPELSRQQPDPLHYQRSSSVTPNAFDAPREEKPYDHARQQSFIAAMSKADNKPRHPLRFGGQASSGGSLPGPMTPFADGLEPGKAPSSGVQNENYSDYTLSTSDQYRRPNLAGFEPAQLPLTPNMKGYTDAHRKESFKKGKESMRADVVRYQVDSARPQSAVSPTNYQPYQGQGPNYQNPSYDTVQGGKPGAPVVFYPGGAHSRQRSLSQGGDEAYASETTGYDGHPQHTIVKPMVNSQGYDQVDAVSQSHTAVQSGLATLPRKKKEQVVPAYSSQNFFPVHDGVNRPNLSSLQDQRANVNPVGLPPIGPGRLDPKSPDQDKKSKKLKKTEKKKSKHDPTKSLDASNYKPPVAPYTSVDSARRPEEYKDEKIVYIDRRMVEKILNHQGLQRQPSTHSTNSQCSSSSIESDSIMGRLMASRHSDGSVNTDVSFDTVSLGSHKDSGYGSSDRNSSSSTGSGTIDPHIQYFLSKSMVVPRSLNPPFMHAQHPPTVSEFTALNPPAHSIPSRSSDGPLKDLSGLTSEEMSRHVYETLTQRKVMHPIKESSQEDILKVLPKEDTMRDNFAEPVGKEGRPPPIPPKNFAAFQVSKSAHHREPSIDSLDKNEVKNDYFISMCEKADDLMDRCILAETQEDLNSALCFCDSALGCLKEAMNQTDISNKALVYAQKKHNSCLLKSRSLFKRTTSEGGKRSSITSSDSDNSDKAVRRVASKERLMGPAKGVPRPGQQPRSTQPQYNQVQGQNRQQQQGSSRSSPLLVSQAPPIIGVSNQRDEQAIRPQYQQYPTSASPVTAAQGPGDHRPITAAQGPGDHRPITAAQGPGDHRPVSHVSRFAAAEKADSEQSHSRSSSNTSIRSSASVPCSLAQMQTPHAAVSSKPQTNPSTAVPLDSYGTQSRNRKPRRTSDPTSNSEVYQMYLNRQKTLQGSTGSDSRELEISRGDGLDTSENCDNVGPRQKFSPVNMGPGGSHMMTATTDFRGQSLETKLGSKYSYDNAGQRGSTSSCGSSSSNQSVTHFNHSKDSQPGGQPLAPFSSVHGPQSSQTGVQQSQQPLYQSSGTHASHQIQPSYTQHSQVTDARQTQNVSGYNQPLPGHRPVVSTHLNQRAATHTGLQPGGQSYQQQTFNTQAQSRTAGRISPIESQSHKHYNQLNNTSSNSGSGGHMQQTSLTTLGKGVQNLSISRNGPPPPPPTRTTSNPGFHPVNHQLYSHQEEPSGDLPPQQRSVARVAPNSHVGQGSEKRNGAGPPLPPYRQPAAQVSGSQGLKHATSSTALNYLPTPRPLERCSSQPDCQNLTEPNSSHKLRSDFLPPSFATSHPTSNPSTATKPDQAQSTAIIKNSMHTSESSEVRGCDDMLPQQSVRALASQFDQHSDKPAIKPKPKNLTRNRSKSESGSKSDSGSKKPKSVLKSKKNKSKAPRKSVTFADHISDLAAGYESAAELTTFSSRAFEMDRAYFSDDDHGGPKSDNEIDDVEDSSNSDDLSLVREELACQLCRKREIEQGKGYCNKCAFYMSRLVSSK
ncbi:unnamed protein product [Lymnaea stagnalis]|uniref:USP domain-containing protein n=1 Tax=Lymnaea stagnalis TaxID=6523 RepID=A0AAV2HAG9_LYMST